MYFSSIPFWVLKFIRIKAEVSYLEIEYFPKYLSMLSHYNEWALNLLSVYKITSSGRYFHLG